MDPIVPLFAEDAEGALYSDDTLIFPRADPNIPGPVPIEHAAAVLAADDTIEKDLHEAEIVSARKQKKSEKQEKKPEKQEKKVEAVQPTKAGKITRGESPLSLFASSGEIPSEKDEVRALRRKLTSMQRFSQLMLTDLFKLKHKLQAVSHECNLARKEIETVTDAVDKLGARVGEMEEDNDPFDFYVWKKASMLPSQQPMSTKWIVIDDEGDDDIEMEFPKVKVKKEKDEDDGDDDEWDDRDDMDILCDILALGH